VSLPVLAEVVRSGFVESVHRGSLVVLGPDGSVVLRLGAPDEAILPRSANKPLQASGMRELGLGLSGELLALSAASHSGEDRHIEGVRAILAGAGLQVDDLQCPADVPYGSQARLAWARAGRRPERVAMNCSGKHAAMLATAVLRGWPTRSYLDAGHPLQQELLSDIEERARERVAWAAVDGCGAPLFGLTLTGLARAVRSLVVAEAGDAGRAVADAMRAFPEYVGGTGRDVTLLMAGVPGLLVKDGAEAVYVAATAAGHSVALKVEDGAARACVPVLVGALRSVGLDAPVLDELAETAVLGGGSQVGVVRTANRLFDR
jgi:L-asparaginase II